MPRPTDNIPGLARTLLFSGLLLSALLSAAYLAHPPFIKAANAKVTDAVMGLVPARPASGSVVIVDIDEKSLAGYGRWPWPRHQVARLLDAIGRSGAASVGLDLILAEPEQGAAGPAGGSSGALRPGRPGTPPASPPDHDREVADALAGGPFVLGYQFRFGDAPPSSPTCELHPPGIVWIDQTPAVGDRPRFFAAQGVVCNRPQFTGAVGRSGFLNATADEDGILRRAPLLIGFGERSYPSLALAMLMKYRGSDQLEIMRRAPGRLVLLVGDRSVSVDTQGDLTLQFSGPGGAAARFSARDLLEGRMDPRQLAGKLVLVGSSAAGLDSVYHTPGGPVLTHADLHAQVLENLLADRQAVRTGVFLVGEALAGVLVSLGAGFAVARCGILASGALSLALLAGSWGAAALLFQARGELFSPLLPSALALLNYASLTVLKTRKIQLAAREAADSTLVLLKSSEQNLNSIINAVPDIIFRLDAAGRLTFVSPAVTRYCLLPDALLGRPILDLVAPEDLPRAHYRLTEKRTGERATRGLELNLLLPHRPGEGKEAAGPFSVSAEGIYRDGIPRPENFLGTQGIMRDIAEQKRLEDRLVQAQKMEAIGHLAAGVAHDLNNILVGLVAYPDLLLLELPPDSPLRGRITQIQQSGEKAAAIVQDLLTLGRRGVTSSEVLNLNAVISEYLASLEFQAAWKQHPATVLESDLAPDLLNIRGARVHLAKVLMNILNNAAEAMPAGGTIRLSSYNRYLDTALNCYEEIPPGEYVCLKVADEGVGIAAEELHRVFEPFYSKKSMRRSGSGLGMTVIWATIKDHGGFIDLRSREGEGTEIELFLPATREQEEQLCGRVVLEDYLGTERLLVVDDVPEQAQIAANMLGKLGYQVVCVASGEAAVAYLRCACCDLVLLDMIMPGGMDGLATYRRILEIRPGQKAIITSGYSESSRVKELQALGAGAYVLKPYTLEKIGVAVRRELDRR